MQSGIRRRSRRDSNFMLDSPGYLSSFGWQGKGNGLRQGSISRPLAIPQKRTLSGLGKDRDEAFPFWDHLFAAASKSIKIKVSGNENETDDATSVSRPPLLRTVTGILSNRRPLPGTPASSGSVTPTDQTLPRLSLMATAKRESARRRLYAGFFKGPVLGPDVDPHPRMESTSVIQDTTQPIMMTNGNGDSSSRKRKHQDEDPGEKTKKSKKSKKSKQKDTSSDLTYVKKRKKEKCARSEAEEKGEDGEGERIQPSRDRTENVQENRQRKATKLERQRRKDEQHNERIEKDG